MIDACKTGLSKCIRPERMMLVKLAYLYVIKPNQNVCKSTVSMSSQPRTDIV
jgi:hypothetical protein